MASSSFDVSSTGSFLSAAHSIASERQKRTTHFMKIATFPNYTAASYWTATVTVRPGHIGHPGIPNLWTTSTYRLVASILFGLFDGAASGCFW